MAYCQRCDKTLDTGEYCPDCGSKLVQPTGREEAAPESQRPGSATGASSESNEWPPEPFVDERGEDYFERGPVKFSLTYPLADGWDSVVITAGLLFLAGLVVFPYIFVYGYAYRLGRAVVRGDHRPPEYGDWGGLFVDGLLLFVVALPFGLVMSTVVLLPAVVGGAVERPLLGAIAIPLFVAGLYVGGGVLPTFMATGSVRETYRGFRFLEFVRTTNYVKALLVGLFTFVALVITLAVVIVALVVTIVGIFFAIPLMIVVQPFLVFFPFVLFGYYYREAMLEEKVSGTANESTLASRL